MVCCGPDTHCAKRNCQKQSAAATNYQRRKNGQNCATSVGFLSARQPDAVAHDRPNSRNQSTAKGDDLQRTGGALSKCEDPECGFKRLVSPAKYHQTEVREATPDEKKDYDAQRHQDDRTEADSHPGHCGKTVILIRK